jgi:hypothetical protein
VIRIALSALMVVAACSGPDTNGNAGAPSGEPPAAETNTTAPATSRDELAPASEGDEAAPAREGPSQTRVDPPPAAASQSCNADKYQYLVGQHRSKIPPKPAGATWRITCMGCPITMDYSESRLNIFYDERSGIIEEVKCG